MIQAVKLYFWYIFIAVDQLANVILFGSPDETLSARAWRTDQKSRWFGMILRPIIDVLFFIITLGKQKHHCRDAYEVERARGHMGRDYNHRR